MALYSKQDLKESQELYQNCEFISKKTRSIYAWRAALWVRFCKERSVDFAVTEDRLIEYLDWLFEIDLVNKINTKKSYVPDILRDHMGSVICLWRIQTGNNPDLVSPKEGSRYQAKWDEILRNHPRRERLVPPTFEQKGEQADAGLGPSGQARSHAGASTSYARDTQYPPQPQPRRQQQHQQQQPFAGHLHPRHHPLPLLQQPQSQQQPQNHHSTRPSLHSYMQLSPYNPPHDPHAGSRLPAAHSPPGPAGLPEPTELAWQLEWLRDTSWAAGAARMLFTTAMATWVDAAHVAGLRLGDVYFASSAMAPSLPSSVMRISLTTGTEPGPLAQRSRSFAATPATRQSFRVMRARNPLSCAWNALASILFHRWHVANAPLPSFADSTWQRDPVLLMESGSASLPSDSTSPGASLLAEGRHLAGSLLPPHQLPMERVVRLQSLERARRVASPGSTSGSDQGDVRMGNSGAPHALAAAVEPLSDSLPPERLQRLTAANSGYYEDYHCIQRHKVIPPDTLQHMIFPWATAMLGAVPAGAGAEERRSVSRFQDFLLDLRIVLLQDIAALKCCIEYLPPGFDTGSILCEPVFNSLEFARFCEAMQRGAADELRALRYDLEVTASHAGGYGSAGHGVSPTFGHPAGGAATAQRSALPAIASPHTGDSIMSARSPHGESFSPIVSPSPPLAGVHDMARNPTLFMDIPPANADAAMADSPQPMARQEISRSMPSHSMEGWGDGFFHGAAPPPPPLTAPLAAIGGGSSNMSQLVARHRRARAPPTPHLASPSSAGTMVPLPGSPYSAVSPRSYWRSVQTHRTERSLSQASQSPRIGTLTAAGDQSMHTTLPPISHIAHVGSSATPPMHGARLHHHHQQYQHHQRPEFSRRETDPIRPAGALRRDSDSTIDNGAAMATGRDEPADSGAEVIAALREENASLRQRMHKLEVEVTQKQQEVQSWMSRIERQLTRGDDA